MTNKKIVVIIVSVVVVLGLLAVLFVGGIAWFAIRAMGNSDAAEAARTFLRNNEALKRDIGEVKDFGWLVSGNINSTNGDGAAQLHLKVIGERKEVNATVELIYRSGRPWRVTAASYRNEAGQVINLLNPYDSPADSSRIGNGLRKLVTSYAS
ncbi:MAG TPA: cytochrome c oxidase assembly factor Coa1 family protein [Pyrinomonadaceae bacterium]|nr:cytochrome c oxidase assembly factor Coa1 family protein [Pyrinomonadaceae bacterium]